MKSALPATSLGRAGRVLPALDPDSVLLDERTDAELMARAPDYARLLNFFDANDKVVSDWTPFWASDASYHLAQVASWQLERQCRPSLEQVHAMARRVDAALQQALASTQAHLAAPDHPLLGALAACIGDELAIARAGLLARDEHAKAWAALDSKYDAHWGRLWQVPPPGQGPDSAALPSLAQVDAIFRHAVSSLAALAETQLQLALHSDTHPAHSALFLAFLRLFRLLQGDMNRFTARHLDYYYEHILRMKQAAGQRDEATVIVQLAANAPSYALPAGTTLSAGQDAQGQQQLYATDHAVCLNQGSVAALATVTVTRTSASPQTVSAITVAPVAASEDGLGAPLVAPALGWSTFGDAGARGTPAQLGYLLCSPMLALSAGWRHVTLSLQLDPTCVPLVDLDTLDQPFLLSLSATAGWYPVRPRLRYFPLCALLVLRLCLPPGAPAVCANAALMPDLANTWPMLKLTLNPEASLYPYSGLAGLNLLGATLRVRVSDLPVSTLATEGGPVAPGKPFAPFGPAPLPGIRYTLSHPELASKPIERLAITTDWLNLPLVLAPTDPPVTPTNNNFTTYYAGYYTAAAFATDLFTVGIALYQQGRWHEQSQGSLTERTSSFYLFQEDGNQNIVARTRWSMQPSVFSVEAGAPGKGAPGAPLPGSVQVSLTGPPYGFCQAQYPQLFAQRAIENIALVEQANAKASLWQDLLALLRAIWGHLWPWPRRAKTAPATSDPVPAPVVVPMLNPPFVPTVAALSLHYRATEAVTLTGEGAGSTCYHLSPFGVGQAATPTLFPLVEDDGMLCIGLAGLTPGQSVSLHLQLRFAPGSGVVLADGEVAAIPGVGWRYLSGSLWKDFPTGSVSGESAQFGDAGIVTLTLPADIASTKGMMVVPSSAPAGTALLWVAACAHRNPGQFARTVAILPQAVRVRRVLPQPVHGSVLAPGSLCTLVPGIGAIKLVSQPYPGSVAASAETLAQCRVRVSERLRHKQRASSARDYEQLVLSTYAGVSHVRCLGPSTSTRLAPGQIALAVLAHHSGAPQDAPPLSRAALLRIAHYLRPLASHWVCQLGVRNVSFETLQVHASLVFTPGSEASVCYGLLNAALHSGLAEQLGHTRGMLAIGSGELAIAAILALIEAQPYVAQVSHLHVVQTADDPSLAPRMLSVHESAAPRLPWSVLVAASEHCLGLPGTTELPTGATSEVAAPAPLPFQSLVLAQAQLEAACS